MSAKHSDQRTRRSVEMEEAAVIDIGHPHRAIGRRHRIVRVVEVREVVTATKVAPDLPQDRACEPIHRQCTLAILGVGDDGRASSRVERVVGRTEWVRQRR